MPELRSGMLVRHSSLGLGKIIALDPTFVHVFFASSEHRFATKLRLAIASPLLAESGAGSAWLDGLGAFALDTRTGRYALPDTSLSHGEAVSRFLEVSPEGFADPAQTTGKDRAACWRRAHLAFEETLGNGNAERLLAAGDLAGLAERLLRVEKHVRPLLAVNERTVLAGALADAPATRTYLEALLAVLAEPAPHRERSEALFAAAATLARGVEAAEARWWIATLLPFVAQPERHVLVRPRLVCEAARRLGFELRYEAEPSWSTYQSVLEGSRRLQERLGPLGARDHVDVEVFMHATTSKRARTRPALRTA